MPTTVIHIGSNVLNKSKFHYIYSFDPKLERQRMGLQESGTKEDGILLVWNSVYMLSPLLLCMGRRPWKCAMQMTVLLICQAEKIPIYQLPP